jgi:hypothetical protein
MLVVGCKPSGVTETAETASPATESEETGPTETEPTDTDPTETEPPVGFVVVEGCGSMRFLATLDGYVLAFSADLDVWSAAISGTPVSATWDLALDDLALAADEEGAFGSGEVCSSVEEWPWDAGWNAGEGTVTVTFTPSSSYPEDDTSWTNDGTILGDLDVWFEGAILLPVGAGEPIEIGDQEGTGPFHTPDLPA